MGLSTYRKKRNFKRTSEPPGLKRKINSPLIFVVQQHSATALHYDFRLEMEGVLKSWAIPKGPSMNPDDKRLAMMVEDHPYDYRDFEGVIPEGNYGAGNVIVWDQGNYHAVAGGNGESDEKILLNGLRKGHINFYLEGKKLKGEFALIKLRGRQENAWLLIKKNDQFASKSDILLKDRSVLSGKKLKMRKSAKQLKKKVLHSEKQEPKKKAPVTIPQLKPMLAELTDAPFDDKDWIFEMKYDGYRALALLDGKGHVELYSRNLISFNNAYADVVEQLKKIKHPALLDGEVVVEDEKGRSHFQLLQQYRKTNEGPLNYYVFDLLNLDGNDLTDLTLMDRKELLKTLLKSYSFKNIFYSEHIVGLGNKFYKAAVKNHLEGIIAKKMESVYVPGKRSSDWMKIKIVKQQEAIIGGITSPKGSRSHFGSLLLGIYENKKLHYVGNCGTGFNQAGLKELYEKFKPYFISVSPFSEKIGLKDVQWISPEFVCEIKFTEWTADGSMRHPVFLGLRTDKKPGEVKKEIPASSRSTKRIAKNKPVKGGGKKKADEQKESTANEVEVKTGGITLKLTNQNKIYFPESKITKGELVNYYRKISSYILPYLKDRPQSQHRFPNGIGAPGFFQKNVDKEKIPDWIKTQKVFSESNQEYIDYIVCNDEATLIYLANLGCIEINPWNSKISSPENPDWMVIDLDPEKISFKEVVRAAQEVRVVFEEMNIRSYCKISGATGLHVYVPLAANYDYDVVKQFAEWIAGQVHERIPETTSIVRSPAKRQGKVYLDFLQNRRGQTLAAPYSARPKPGATVSTPLEWSEVNEKLSPEQFTIRNILKRIEKKGDLWKPVIGKGVNLRKIIETLA